MQNEKLIKLVSSLTLTLSWLTLMVSASFIIFRTDLHSDSLFLESLYTDLITLKGEWNHWKLTPAPAFFPDMLLYFISSSITHLPAAKVVFVTVTQAILLATLSIFLIQTINPDNKTLSKILVINLVSIFAITASNSKMWLFFNSTNNHFSAIVLSLLTAINIMKYYFSQKTHNLFVTFVWIVLGTISTSLFTLNLTLPLLVFCALCLKIDSEKNKKIHLSVIILIFISHIFSIFAGKKLLPHDALTERVPLTADRAVHSFNIFLEASKDTFSTKGFITFALAVSTVTMLLYVVVHFLKSSNHLIFKKTKEKTSCLDSDLEKKIYFGSLFFIISLAITISGSLVSGGFVDLYGYRYFSFPINIGLILFISILFSKNKKQLYFIKKKKRFHYALISLPVFLLAFSFILKRKEFNLIPEYIQSGTPNSIDNIAKCVNEVIASGKELSSGVSDYWQARGVSLKTKNKNYILAATNDLSPFFHMMSLGPLMETKKYKTNLFNFIILNYEKTATPFNFTIKNVSPLLPKPSKVFKCAHHESEIWYYEDSELDKVIRKKISPVLVQSGYLKSYFEIGANLPSQVGKKSQTSMVINEQTGNKGYLTYGPYLKAKKGDYKVTLFYSASAEGNSWDIGRFNKVDSQMQLASGELPKQLSKMEKTIRVKKEIEDLEIRVWFNGVGNLEVKEISIEKL